MISTLTPFQINENKIIYTKNEHHLGDCIFCCIFFYNIKKYIEENNITIYFYCQNENIDQIKEFNCSKNIIMLPLSEIPNSKKIHNLHIGFKEYKYNFLSQHPISYDVFLCKFYNQILKILEIPIEIEKFIYEDNDLLIRLEKINKKTNNKYNDIDFLIVNGEPKSGQFYEYNVDEWNNFITLLSQKYNVVTTQKVEGVKCTRDDNLTVKDIASISTNNIKTIIAIDTGPTCSFYNKYTIENTGVFYILCNDWQRCDLSFPNVIKKNRLSELFFLIDEKKIDSFSNYNDEIRKFELLSSIIIIGLLFLTIFNYKKI